jgi:hypothetical protein
VAEAEKKNTDVGEDLDERRNRRRPIVGATVSVVVAMTIRRARAPAR